ncbi:MAG: WD40 repeat domain-containing protein, partial [Acidimicrobiia bacterium]
TCPYKGLAAFQPEDASLFFGREAFVDELVGRLRTARKLVIGGPSGSGKSSLLRAGLIPAVESGALPGSQNWRVLLFTPGPDALAELHHQIVTFAPDGSVPSVAELRSDPRSVRAAARAEPGVLLAIDQFEELFTLNPSGDAECFVAVLAELVDPPRSQVRVAISLRADFYGASALHPWLARCISDNQVLVGPMQRAELRRAIEGPAHRVGLRLEPGLVDAILDEEGAEPGSLPLVAHALMETWLRRRGSLLTLDGFRAAGGVAGALAQRADELYETKFSDDEQIAARRLLLRLVNAGDGVPDTRRRITWDELGADDATRRAVDTLADARLLSVDSQTVEIAHEAIIQTWPRLRRWIDDTRDDLRTRQRIDRAAAEWDGQERNPALLYRGTPLDASLEWAGAHPEELSGLDRDFLETSEGVRSAERNEAEAVARRGQRVRWAAIGALATLATAAVIASLVALVALQRSRADARDAREASTLANERFARALATQSMSASPDDPLLGIGLAAESISRSAPPLAEARSALVEARVARADAKVPVPFGAPLPVGDALTATLSPDGETLVIGGRDGEVTVWDVAAGRERSRLDGHTGGVQEAAIDPGGEHVATAGADGTVWLWDLTERSDQPADPFVDLDAIIWSVAFSPDGSTLATASEDGTVRLFDAETGEQRGDPLGVRPGADFITVAFSPRGDRLVAGTGTGEVLSWLLPSRAPLPPFVAHTSDVWELVFDPSGGRLFTGSSDGTARVWSVGDSQLLEEPFRRPDRTLDVDVVSGIVVSPDGGDVYVGGDDGAVWSWDVATAGAVGPTAIRHPAPIIDAARSADGTRLATLDNDQTVRFWDLSPAPPATTTLAELDGPAFGISADRSGRHLAVGGGDGRVQLLDARTGEPEGELDGQAGQVFGVAYLPSGAAIVTGDESGALRKWDRTTRRRERERRAAHAGPITNVAVSPDGSLVASSSDDGTVRVWDARTLTPRTDALGPHMGGAKKVVFSPDGAQVIAVTGDGKVRIWGIDGQEGATIEAGVDALWSVAVSRDGSLLATAGGDGVVALWRLADPSVAQRELTPHPEGATDVAFTDDGETLVTTSRDGSVRFWDRRTGQLLGRPFVSHSDTVWRVAVGHDRPIVWTAGVDGQVHSINVLDLDRACDLAASSFDRRQRERFVGGEQLQAC